MSQEQTKKLEFKTLEDNPNIYIDLPYNCNVRDNTSNSNVSGSYSRRTEETASHNNVHKENNNLHNGNINEKSKEDNIPTVYIDIPNNNLQSVQSPELFTTVHPIENRLTTPQTATTVRNIPNDRSRPPQERHRQDLQIQLSPEPFVSRRQDVQLQLSSEAFVSRRQPTPDDDFPLSPIPVPEYREPPPAYTEATQATAATEQGPRRVTVNVDPDRSDLPPSHQKASRKYLQCQHCFRRVHTMVVRQSGPITHVIAVSSLLFCMFPITLLAYCTKFFKYRNHYCPNCNKLIGYEVPFLCQKLILVEPRERGVHTYCR